MQAVVSGFSLQIPFGVGIVLLTPAAGIATGTCTLPKKAPDGFTVRIAASQAIAAFTVLSPPGATIVGSVAGISLAAGTSILLVYSATATAWYRIS
jgi:hypothetical protein